MLNEKTELDAAVPPGFRLDRLELWNWGTFHRDVQVLEPRHGWTLLVGDNGSGKSTAIDALRTLLVPPRILNYNDASGDGPSGRSRPHASFLCVWSLGELEHGRFDNTYHSVSTRGWLP